MTLVEVTPLAPEALPTAALRAHLRLGSGFAEEALQDDLLQSFLRAALAAIEARISKALIARDFELTLSQWQHPAGQPFPLAPVSAVTSVTVIDDTGTAVLDPSRYHLSIDPQRPVLRPTGTSLPVIPKGGRAEIHFTAGFGAWEALPADLAQAVLMLAAHFYEYRHDTALSAGCMPFGVAALLERYRPLRLGTPAGAAQ